MCCADTDDGHVNRTNAVRYQLETGVRDVSTILRGKAGHKNSQETVKGKRAPHTGLVVLSTGLGPGCSLQGLVCCPKRENRGAAEAAVMTPSWEGQLDSSWWYLSYAKILPEQRHQDAECSGKGCMAVEGFRTVVEMKLLVALDGSEGDSQASGAWQPGFMLRLLR